MAERICAVTGCVKVGQTRRGMCDMHYRRWRRTGTTGPSGSLRIIGDDLTRFWSHVDQNGSLPEHVEWLGACWIWTGHTDPNGYGHIKVDAEVVRCHLWAYRAFVGRVPVGLELDHLCRNTACVRVSHKSENVRRRNLARSGKPWLQRSA